MHELSVAQSILDISLEVAHKENALRVKNIYLRIGDLSTIIGESVQFYWDFISEGTVCEGSKLEFTREPAILRCNKCGTNYPLKEELTPCPNCTGIDIQVIKGEEFQIDRIDYIEEDPFE